MLPGLFQPTGSRLRPPTSGRPVRALLLALAFAAALPAAALAEDGTKLRGSTTGPTSAKGFDYPGHSLHMKDEKPADNMYPALSRP